STARFPLVALAFLPLLTLARTASAQTYRLNPPFTDDVTVGAVQDFVVHPSGAEVLFRADAKAQGAFGLYHVPLDGHLAPQPVAVMPVDRAVTQYAFSPDGQWVVYLADRDANERFELYSHRVGTFGSRKLNAPLAEGRDVTSFQVSPDSTRVVYT